MDRDSRVVLSHGCWKIQKWAGTVLLLEMRVPRNDSACWQFKISAYLCPRSAPRSHWAEGERRSSGLPVSAHRVFNQSLETHARLEWPSKTEIPALPGSINFLVLKISNGWFTLLLPQWCQWIETHFLWNFSYLSFLRCFLHTSWHAYLTAEHFSVLSRLTDIAYLPSEHTLPQLGSGGAWVQERL